MHNFAPKSLPIFVRLWREISPFCLILTWRLCKKEKWTMASRFDIWRYLSITPESLSISPNDLAVNGLAISPNDIATWTSNYIEPFWDLVYYFLALSLNHLDVFLNQLAILSSNLVISLNHLEISQNELTTLQVI